MTTAQRSTVAGIGTGPIALIAVALGALALVATAVGLVLAGGSYEPALPGLPDPGATVGWGTPVVRLLSDLAAVATVGWLLAATFLDPSGKDGVVSPTGRRDLRRAAIAAAAWAVLALVQLFLELANVLGLPLAEAVSPNIVSTYANEIPTTRALLFMALLATVVCIGAIMTATTGSAAAWLLVAVAAAALPALAGHSSGLGDHALATTAGVAHVVAAVVWMGGLVALGVHAARRDMPLLRPVQRFSTIALVAIVLLAASGAANAYTRLDNAGQLFTTGYGQVLVTKTLLIVTLGILGWVIRGRIIATLDRASRAIVFARIAGLELLVMAVAVGLGVALASSPPPRVEVLLPTYGESLLGFPYPPPPTAAGVGLGFSLDPLFLTASLIAAALYIAGAVRLARRGDRWPWLRTASWLTGIAIVIWCTNAGISVYAQVSVGLHMLQHMTLTMLGPIFLVLGAPATLALRALRPAKGNERGPREWLVWFLHSWITRLLTNPFYVFFIYVIGLYGLYFTPAFGWLMGSHVGHVAMQMHFIVSGLPLLLDPHRHRPASEAAPLLGPPAHAAARPVGPRLLRGRPDDGHRAAGRRVVRHRPAAVDHRPAQGHPRRGPGGVGPVGDPEPDRARGDRGAVVAQRRPGGDPDGPAGRPRRRRRAARVQRPARRDGPPRRAHPLIAEW